MDSWKKMLAALVVIGSPISSFADEIIFPVGSYHIEQPRVLRREINPGIGYWSEKHNIKALVYLNSRILGESLSLLVVKKTRKLRFRGVSLHVEYGGVYYDDAKKIYKTNVPAGQEIPRYKPYIKPVAMLVVGKEVGDGFIIEAGLTWKLATAQIVYKF